MPIKIFLAVLGSYEPHYLYCDLPCTLCTVHTAQGLIYNIAIPRFHVAYKTAGWILPEN